LKFQSRKSDRFWPLTLKLDIARRRLKTLLMPGCVSGFTVTVKLCVALRLGVPMSETFSVKLFVSGLRDQRAETKRTPLLCERRIGRAGETARRSASARLIGVRGAGR